SRRDAFQFLLLTESRSKAEARAIAAVSGDDPGIRIVGLQYLAMGPYRLQTLREHITVNLDVSAQFQEMVSNEPRVFRPPAGLRNDTLQKLLAEKDRDTVVSAAYLLALGGRTDVIETLVRAWREGAARDDTYQQLVYRAIAATNDESRVSLLEEMYAGF